MRGLWFAILLLWSAGASAHDIDPTHLPLGDGRISTEPKQGYLWACRIDRDAGGAFRDGPWIHADGTYDLTAKPSVSGDVRWPHQFTISMRDGRRILATNDLPNHGTGIFPIAPSEEAFRYDRNPNHIATQNVTIELPSEPALAASPGCAPGAIGILITGTVLFNAVDAPGRDAVAHEVQDACQGHPQETGVYHYHAVSPCIDDKREPDGSSALVGYALDGFGIYGRFGEGGKELGSADLDECHGRVSPILWDGKRVEMFHYVATRDFPYTVGCLRGTYDRENVRRIAGPPPRRPPPPN